MKDYSFMKFYHCRLYTSPLFDVRMKPVLDESGEKRLSSFGEELFKGKAIADAQVEQSLYKSCTGYSVEEKEELVEVGSCLLYTSRCV